MSKQWPRRRQSPFLDLDVIILRAASTMLHQGMPCVVVQYQRFCSAKYFYFEILDYIQGDERLEFTIYGFSDIGMDNQLYSYLALGEPFN
jgi:hypothetical protein